MAKLSLLSPIFLLGCFNPDLSRYPVRCDSDNLCPSGQVCVSSICQAAADQGFSLDGSSAPDAGQSGCATGGGTPLGKAWACPGTFARGAAASQCAAGCQLCTSATGIDVTACNALSNFFIANVQGKRALEPPEQAICGMADMMLIYPNPLWYGCGHVDFTKNRTVNAVNACSGFSESLDCQGGAWDCTGGGLALLRNSGAPNDGVLCCSQ